MQADGFIYLIGSDEQVTEFVKTPYQDEAKFQHLLADHLRLIPGDQVDQVEPRRWLLVRREMGVPDEEGGNDRWSLDHLYLLHK